MNGVTAIMKAVMACDFSLCRMLLEFKSDALQQTSSGSSALHLAHEDIIAELLRKSCEEEDLSEARPTVSLPGHVEQVLDELQVALDAQSNDNCKAIDIAILNLMLACDE